MSIFRPFKYKNKPDLLPDAPVKHGFFVFWEILFRKFWRLASVNFFYFVVTLPILIWVYLMVNGYFAIYVFPEDEFFDLLQGISVYAALITYIPEYLHMPLLALSVLLYGPATMGVTYIYRNFSRQEHAWVSDFFSRAKSNLRQGIFFGIFDVIIAFLLISGMLGGVISGPSALAILSVILRTLCGVVLVVFLFMRHYFYVTAVTVELGVFKIIKNAMLFVVIGFGRNVLALVISLIVIVVTFFTIPFVAIVALPMIFYSFTGFTTTYICYPVIKKYIIVPALELESKQHGEEESNS